MTPYLTDENTEIQTMPELIAYRNRNARQLRHLMDEPKGLEGRREELLHLRNKINKVNLAIADRGGPEAPVEGWMEMGPPAI